MIFKKFVNIKNVGTLLKTSIRSRLTTDKLKPKLKYSHLLPLKEYLQGFEFTKIHKINSFNLKNNDANKGQKEIKNSFIPIQQDLKWKKEKENKPIQKSK